jgi:hypothetical protein
VFGANDMPLETRAKAAAAMLVPGVAKRLLARRSEVSSRRLARPAPRPVSRVEGSS